MERITINENVKILEKVLSELTTFDNEQLKMDYILDVCSAYEKELLNHYSTDKK